MVCREEESLDTMEKEFWENGNGHGGEGINMEDRFEAGVRRFNQLLYDMESGVQETGTKVFLFSGLVMCAMPSGGRAPLTEADFSGKDLPMTHIGEFLRWGGCDGDTSDAIVESIKDAFLNPAMWECMKGRFVIGRLFGHVLNETVPFMKPTTCTDIVGRIMNILSDWKPIENDESNDVVLTPGHVALFMARLCRTDMDSRVWDSAAGTGGLLTAAVQVMVQNAMDHGLEGADLEDKVKDIKERQVAGMEILDNIHKFAVINMIFAGIKPSCIHCGDASVWDGIPDRNVLLLNPPYSAAGHGLVLAERALSSMRGGYAAVLVQESAGTGQGEGYPEKILRKNTLVASVRMPSNLFPGKAGVQTAVYVFRAGRPHRSEDNVKFIDFGNDGYERHHRRKSGRGVNFRDTGNAGERYAEVEAIVLGRRTETSYYTKENGLYLEDTIGTDGNDWGFMQHRKIGEVPAENDFRRAVSEHMEWMARTAMQEAYAGRGTDIGSRAWKKYRLDKIFRKVQTGKTRGKAADFPSRPEGTRVVPLLTAGIDNHGLARYADRTQCPTVMNGVISISANGANSGVSYYQEGDFAVLQDAYAVDLVDGHIPGRREGLFLVACMNRLLHGNFGWTNKAGWNNIRHLEILLPSTEDGTPDWEYMNAYIAELEGEYSSALAGYLESLGNMEKRRPGPPAERKV